MRRSNPTGVPGRDMLGTITKIREDIPGDTPVSSPTAAIVDLAHDQTWQQTKSGHNAQDTFMILTAPMLRFPVWQQS